jgi:predicted DNA-binding protein (MmcQ/YjbR family)
VGHRGWLGIYLDSDIDDNEVAGAIEDAYVEVAPKWLLKRQDLGDAG